LGIGKKYLNVYVVTPAAIRQCGFPDRQQHGMVADRFVVTGAKLQKVRTAL
jgi:hypothetical protein